MQVLFLILLVSYSFYHKTQVDKLNAELEDFFLKIEEAKCIRSSFKDKIKNNEITKRKREEKERTRKAN